MFYRKSYLTSAKLFGVVGRKAREEKCRDFFDLLGVGLGTTFLLIRHRLANHLLDEAEISRVQ